MRKCAGNSFSNDELSQLMSNSFRLRDNPDFPDTVSDAIRGWARFRPDATAVRLLRTGAEREELSGKALDEKADLIAAFLTVKVARGDRVLLLFRPGPEFVAALIGCLRAGAIAVPTMLPGAREGLQRLTAVIENCEPRLALSHAEARAALDDFIISVPIVEIDSIAGLCSPVTIHPQEADIAILQYTSGSTGTPKGVMISHGNLMNNIAALMRRFDVRSSTSVVSWLPHYHDMGLIGAILCPLMAGRPAVLMSPGDFLRNPLSWLQAISQYKCGIITAPTFAYELCGRRLEAASRSRLTDLDLSCVRVAIVGSEMIRESSLARSARAAATCGFSPNSFSILPTAWPRVHAFLSMAFAVPWCELHVVLTARRWQRGRVEAPAGNHKKLKDTVTRRVRNRGM